LETDPTPQPSPLWLLNRCNRLLFYPRNWQHVLTPLLGYALSVVSWALKSAKPWEGEAPVEPERLAIGEC
jgi:hypothetical protein